MSIGVADIDITRGLECCLAIIDERFARVPEYGAKQRAAFLQAYAPIADDMKVLDYRAEDSADDIAIDATMITRLAVIAFRPINDTERATKAAWLFSEFGDGKEPLEEPEINALLASLYPANV